VKAISPWLRHLAGALDHYRIWRKKQPAQPAAFLSEMVQFWTANYLRVANHQRGTQEFTGRLSAQELICQASEA
jgi:hypothetical protein